MKRLQIPQKLVYEKLYVHEKNLRTRNCTKNFTYTKIFYVHEIAAVNLSKVYFLKNAKKACKPNNRVLNRDWIISDVIHSTGMVLVWVGESLN